MKKGFTLIELLVVVLIIGILSSVALPQYTKAVGKARFVQAMILGDALTKAAERYVLANGQPPSTLDELDIEIAGELSNGNKTVSNGKYNCEIGLGGEGDLPHFYCAVEGLDVRYRSFYFPVNGFWYGRYCVADEEDEKSNKLCVSLGGEFFHDNGKGQNLYKLK
ncbi:type IV pilin protein [Candidatus Avelusimicrobium sp.]